MTSLLRLLALLIAFVLPLGSLSADGAHTVKCSVNQERVWVYDSPATLNVADKLKCGESVTPLAHENGFVKVRTANGTEGYVPAENLPSVGAASVATAASANGASQPNVAGVARAATAAPAAAVHPDAQSTAAVASHAITASKPPAAAQPKSSNPPAPAAATATTAPALPTHVATASATSHSKMKKSTKTAGSTTAAASTKTSPNTTTPTVAHPTSGALVRTAAASSGPGSTYPPAASSSADKASTAYVGTAPVGTTAKSAAMRNTSNAASDEEGDDNSYLILPKSESDDPACRSYFSGYGLSPGQFKWVVDNRQKRFPAVCPAATPAMVDYVIIFTHDVEFFNYTMPDPVHTEAGGFTDWNPIVLYDMSSVPRNEIDKSKREYVWVFHVKRGTYDPAKFSPHRRFQFTKIESKYSRTVEDAFEYIEAQGADR